MLQVLGISRVMVAWQPVGVAAGVYDMCVRYVIERRQFDRPLAAFQLVQERLARMAGALQGMWLSAWRLSALLEAGTMTHAQVRMHGAPPRASALFLLRNPGMLRSTCSILSMHRQYVRMVSLWAIA